jgi:hypothetical protein
MFHSLLQIVNSQMICRKHVAKCKTYIEMLNANPSDLGSKCIEIMKLIIASKEIGILEPRPETNEEEPMEMSSNNSREDVVESPIESENNESSETNEEEPMEMASNNSREDVVESPIESENNESIFDYLSAETVREVAQRLIKVLSSNEMKAIELMMSGFINKAIDDPSLCIKLSREIEATWSFKELLFEICQNEILSCTKSGKLELKTIGLINFIGNLYNENFVPDEFIKLSLQILLGKEVECDVAVDCIRNLIRTVGLKMEDKCKSTLNVTFKFFHYVAEQEKESYRSITFSYLVDLRHSAWNIEITNAMPMIEFYFKLATDNDSRLISSKLKNFIGNSEAISMTIIRKVWEVVIRSPKLTKLCVSLMHEISEVQVLQDDGTNSNLGDLLERFLTARQETFSKVLEIQPTEAVKNRLGYVAIFVAELFVLGVLPDTHMIIWLERNLTQNLNVNDAAALSSLINSKISETGNVELKMKLIALDTNVKGDVKKIASSIQSEIQELNDRLSK